MNYTKKVAEYIAEFQYDHMPPDAISKTKEIVLDTLGVLIRASISKGASDLMIRFGSQFGAEGRCSIIGAGMKTDPITAAFVNGTLGHDIIELDEVHAAANTHTSAVLIPAALAVAEHENRPGRHLIEAVALAFDIECRIGIALDNTRVYHRAFHPSSVAGCFGATTAASHLLKLDAPKVVFALGLAGSQASGLIAWENESEHMSKSFQTGMAARNGVTSALLAQMGFEAAPQILDGKYNIFDAFSGKTNFEALTEDLGIRFEVMRAGLKRYACCRYIHAPLDGFLNILDTHQLTVDDIQRVTVKLSETGAPIVDGNPLITHNAQYAISIAAFYKKVGIEQYTDDLRNDPQILDFSKEVQVQGDPELQKVYPEHWAAIVEVESKDGKRFIERVDDAKGEPANPFSQQEVEEKFMNLATQVISPKKAKEIIGRVNELENAIHVSAITDLMKA